MEEVENMNILTEIKGISYAIDIFMIFLSAIYLFFAFLVVRQTKMLNNSFKTDAAKFLSRMAGLHFFGALVVLGAALIGLMLT